MTDLSSGSNYHGQLTKAKRIAFFTFTPASFFFSDQTATSSPEFDTDTVEINLRGSKDKIVVMVNNDNSFPDDKKKGFIWSSSNGILIIKKSDPSFVKDATYKIAVMATEHAFSLTPNTREEFNQEAPL